jgi:WD40 repeat protein
MATAITPEVPPRRIITASSDASIRLWPFADGKPQANAQVLTGHGEMGIDVVRVSADGRWMVSIDIEGNACRWDLSAKDPQQSKLVLPKVLHRRHVVQLSPDGKWLLTGDENGMLHVYDVQTKQPRRDYKCASDVLEVLAIDTSGKQVLVGDTLGNITRVELTAAGELKNPVRLTGHVGSCVAIAIAPDSTYCVTGSFDQTARLWDLSEDNKKVPPSLSLTSRNDSVNAVAVSSDGKWIATATADGTVLLWNLGRCRLILKVTGGDMPQTKAPTQTT